MQQVTKNNNIIQAIRGSITDRNGYELVFSKRVYNVIFDPSIMKNLDAETLTAMKDAMYSNAGITAAEIDNALSKTDKKYAIVKKAITKEQKENISFELEDYSIPGLSYEEDFIREYLGNNFACHLIGFATNGTGRWGLEYQYDKYLKGVSGREFVTFKNDIPSTETKDAKDGSSLVLTIDKNIQSYCEDALVHLSESYDPLKASIIVMNPSTGEVLAMANYPNFNLNEPNAVDNEYYQHIFEKFEVSNQIQKTYNTNTKTYDNTLKLSDSDKLNLLHKNIAVSDTYEPGSTFKPLVVSAAFEEGIISETSTFVCNGSLQVADKKIGCMGTHGPLTPRQILQKSCNVGVMEIAAKMGRTKFYAYQKAFGVGEKTGIDLPGEASGSSLMYSVEQLNDTELATSSFGQSFQLTPLQMLTSFSAVINGGKLLKPYVVSEIVDPNGSVVYQNGTVELRRVISNGVSILMKDYLQSCVEDGLAKGIRIEGYEIGGKTGTSEKIPRELGKVVTSFVSFAPVNDPQIAMIVTVDDPKGQSLFGSSVAGPASKEILEKTLSYLGVPKSNYEYNVNSVSSQSTVGKYTDMNLVEAINSIKNNNLSYKINGEGSKVTSQDPSPYTKLNYNGVVTLNVSSNGKTVAMPNVIGQTYADAYKIIVQSGLKLNYNEEFKNKVVDSQIPLQGVKIDSGTTVIIGVKD